MPQESEVVEEKRPGGLAGRPGRRKRACARLAGKGQKVGSPPSAGDRAGGVTEPTVRRGVEGGEIEGRMKALVVSLY